MMRPPFNSISIIDILLVEVVGVDGVSTGYDGTLGL